MNWVRWARCAIACVSAVLAVTCGGGSPSSPDPPVDGATTIIINSSGVVSPKQLEIALGARVTFRNNDARTHDMASDPHPDHSDCPQINQVGFLNPGQSRQTGNFTTAQTCGFHDHDRDTDPNLKGTIVVR